MYQKTYQGYPAPNGIWRDFFFRENTNDENTVQAVFKEDEYHIASLPVRDKGVIIDIGGHIGTFSVLAATLFPTAKVYAYEPAAENLELFQETIKRNKLENRISANLKAVWGKAEQVITIYFGDETAFGMQHRFNCSHFQGWGKTDVDKKFDIETESLHSILTKNKIDKVDILKIDCEGSEYEIFKKSSKKDLQRIDYIIGEYHNTQKPPLQDPRKELLNCLQGLFEDISEKPLVDIVMPKLLPDIPYHGDFIFRRKM